MGVLKSLLGGERFRAGPVGGHRWPFKCENRRMSAVESSWAKRTRCSMGLAASHPVVIYDYVQFCGKWWNLWGGLVGGL